mgnify:CR=1 FL=1
MKLIKIFYMIIHLLLKGDFHEILVTPTSMQPGKNTKALERLEHFTSNLVFNQMGRPLSEDELIPLLKDCDGYIAGLDDVTKR